MEKNCLVIGDLNIDLIMTELNNFPELEKEVIADNYVLDIGGSGGIFSAVLSQIGIKTYIISKISNDLFGNLIIKILNTHGVKIDKIILDDNKKSGLNTGITINISLKKAKSQISSVKLIKSLSIDDIKYHNIKNLKHVHFTSYYIMDNLKTDYLKLIESIKTDYPDVTFSLDTNYDPTESWETNEIYKILSHINILFVNKTEALGITGESDINKALDILAKKVEMTIIKLGNEGYMASCKDEYYADKAPKAVSRDSTGAGDNFDAGFIYGYINGLDVERSLKIANICGAKSIEYFGGAGDNKKFSELKKLIIDKY